MQLPFILTDKNYYIPQILLKYRAIKQYNLKTTLYLQTIKGNQLFSDKI